MTAASPEGTHSSDRVLSHSRLLGLLNLPVQRQERGDLVLLLIILNISSPVRLAAYYLGRYLGTCTSANMIGYTAGSGYISSVTALEPL